jgi:chitinase
LGEDNELVKEAQEKIDEIQQNIFNNGGKTITSKELAEDYASALSMTAEEFDTLA